MKITFFLKSLVFIYFFIFFLIFVFFWLKPYYLIFMETKPLRAGKMILLVDNFVAHNGGEELHLIKCLDWSEILDNKGNYGIWILNQYLKSNQISTRRNALWVASGMKTLRSIEVKTLIKIFKEDEDEGVRAFAGFALEKHGKAKGEKNLIWDINRDVWNFKEFLEGIKISECSRDF